MALPAIVVDVADGVAGLAAAGLLVVEWDDDDWLAKAVPAMPSIKAIAAAENNFFISSP